MFYHSFDEFNSIIKWGFVFRFLIAFESFIQALKLFDPQRSLFALSTAYASHLKIYFNKVKMDAKISIMDIMLLCFSRYVFKSKKERFPYFFLIYRVHDMVDIIVPGIILIKINIDFCGKDVNLSGIINIIPGIINIKITRLIIIEIKIFFISIQLPGIITSIFLWWISFGFRILLYPIRNSNNNCANTCYYICAIDSTNTYRILT